METKKSWLRKDLDALRLQWDMLTFYERFEQLVAHVLSVVISVITLVSLWQLIRAVILPAALPSIFTGIYLALIYSWLATLGAEYLLVAGSGIGNTLIDGSEQFRMDLVLFGVIVVGVTGWALNALARAAERAIFARRSQVPAR